VQLLIRKETDRVADLDFLSAPPCEWRRGLCIEIDVAQYLRDVGECMVHALDKRLWSLLTMLQVL
jgi:hypothetical protein